MEFEHEWLTTVEVAEMYRVTTKTVACWCKQGKYPRKYLQRTNGDRPGSKWLIHRDAFKPVLKQLKTTPSISEEERIRRVVEKGRELLKKL